MPIILIILGITLGFTASVARAADVPNSAKLSPDQLVENDTGFLFPNVPLEHKHVRLLLKNALRYFDPKHKISDPVSGYPVEGWNHDPKNGVYLRSFTQLTAIGLWMEMLGNVVAGNADSPSLSRQEALAGLTRIVASLRHDQHDPHISARGLLGNFLDLTKSSRQGPLASQVDKQKFDDAMGLDKSQAIWLALKERGWIVPLRDGRLADIHRGADYGANFFTGPMAPYAASAMREKIMAILDERVVMIEFGDNANLSASAAKTIGALLSANIKDQPAVAGLRSDLERFLDDQQEGYAHLYDPKTGLFFFGWDTPRNLPVGWEDPHGKWQYGHTDYLVNEFRDPVSFVVMRYGLPDDPLRNLGFKMKPYRLRDGRELYVLAPWEGSAFQAIGLELSMLELSHPGWRNLLQSAVDVELDYAERHALPGFLSECYSGNGTQYTGNVGIPEITVDPSPRITTSASLYTLGVAYRIAPDKIENFLAKNWPVISTLLTDHGPWEGFDTVKKTPIKFQTSAHTLSLILGLLGRGSHNMHRYLEFKRLGPRLEQFYRAGEPLDLLGDSTRVFAWAEKGATLQSKQENGSFQVTSERAAQMGIAFVSNLSSGVNVSSGRLKLHYRSATPLDTAVLELKPPANPAADPSLISRQIFLNLPATNGQGLDIEIPLPATPGLNQVKEIVLTRESKLGQSIDFAITRFGFAPFEK